MRAARTRGLGAPSPHDDGGPVVFDPTRVGRVIRHHSRSFYFASLFLPARKRRDTWILYAWCRHMDDSVDEGAAEAEERRGALAGWREWLRAGAPADRADGLRDALAEVIRRNAIPTEPFLALLDGVESDLTRRRIATGEELAEYAYQVGSTVGLMLVRVFGRLSEDADEYACALGHAMQLTNILRDVGEDIRQRDRVYLPAEDLAAHGVSEDDLRAERLTDGFVELMREEVARTRECYDRAAGLYQRVERDARVPCAAAACVYADILSSIERNGYDSLTRRATVSTGRKLALVPQAWRLARS